MDMKMSKIMQEQYDLAIKALKEVGVTDVPKFEDIKFPKKLPKNVQLVITPEITKDFTFYDLVNKYNSNNYIWYEMWDQYDLTSPMTASLVLMDGDNSYDEDVLRLTNKTLEEQRQALPSGKSFVDPVTYIMLSVIRKLQGKEVLNKRTWLRFAGLSNKTVVGVSWVGSAYSDGDRLGADGSHGIAHPLGGVGVSVGLDLDFKPSTSSAISFSLPERLEINGEVYVKE
jgi:hypothetical protein